MEEKGYKITGAILAGIATEYLEAYGPIFIFVTVAVCLDVITGLIRSAAVGDAINSKTASRGFWKKIALFCALLFGVFLDAFLPKLLGLVSITVPFNFPFTGIIGCYICINESISICENILQTNAISMPKWIKKLLTGAKKTIDEAEKKDTKSEATEPETSEENEKEEDKK